MHGIINIVGDADLRPLHNNRTKMALSMVIHAFKSSVTRKIHETRNSVKTVWQRSFYDHVIRNEKSLQDIREYTLNNPRNWQYDAENKDRIVMKGAPVRIIAEN